MHIIFDVIESEYIVLLDFVSFYICLTIALFDYQINLSTNCKITKKKRRRSSRIDFIYLCQIERNQIRRCTRHAAG